MEKDSGLKYFVADSGDVMRALKDLKHFMIHEGFSQKDAEEVAVAASELGTNIYKYADHGELHFCRIVTEKRIGVRIDAVDNGPGIPDINLAVTDSYSSGKSLGLGLGTVNRIMDELNIDSNINKGTNVTAVRWQRTESKEEVPCPYDYGVATRPYLNMKINGDAYIIKKWENYLLVSVIDGLGHGQYAFRASQKAWEYIDSHHDLPLDEIFRGVGKSCFGTRGVVMALAKFDWKENTVTYANIGNIDIKVFGIHDWKGLVLRRGIIGVNAPGPVVEKRSWDSEGIFIMQSDGITTHWQRNDIVKLYSDSAYVNAREILTKYGKYNDDATVIVVKGKKNE